ncbi:MAG: hypothetical protein JWN26_685 [Candidatus Saccharibacteria bacterium]|nr:hypothetical protein [Candidatus Saccharibacteria bacterium]
MGHVGIIEASKRFVENDTLSRLRNLNIQPGALAPVFYLPGAEPVSISSQPNNVIDKTNLFRSHGRIDDGLAKQGLLLTIRSMPPTEDSYSPLEEMSDDIELRIDKIASSMYDALDQQGYNREADFLFGICKHIAESGGSDAEIGHTAFEYIKQFPEVQAVIELQAAADDIKFRKSP